MTSLAERLGFSTDRRTLIVTADTLGFSYGANVGAYQSLREGIATSASLMVPAPWARGAAAEYRGEDVGVRLTLNAELDLYRWGPLTHAPSLLDGDGGFPRTVADVWDHADLDEVRREWRAQLERAIYWGFDVSHLNAHLDGVELKPEFFDVYLDLAEEFRFPLRLPAQSDEARIGFPIRMLAAERDILAPDRVISLKAIGLDRDSIAQLFDDLEPGITEICVQPALDTEDLRAAEPDWQRRVDQLAILARTSTMAKIAEQHDCAFIGYRALRDLMRATA